MKKIPTWHCGLIMVLIILSPVTGCESKSSDTTGMKAIQAAREAYHRGDWDSAQREALRAETLLPEKSEPPLLAGKALFFQEKYPAAERAFRRAAGAGKENTVSCLWLARALLEQNSPEEADEVLLEVLQTHPRNIEALYLSARSALTQKNLPEALIYLERGETEIEQFSVLFFIQARLYYQLGFPERSKKAAKRCGVLLASESPLTQSLATLVTVLEEESNEM